MCMVVGLVFAGGTILFTALPNVARELNATQTSALWMADVYPLVIAALRSQPDIFALHDALPDAVTLEPAACR